MTVAILDLGRAAYPPVLERMRQLHLAVQNGAPGEVWLVEHEPVYTAGRGTPPEQLGPAVVPIERGGKITYHGPGQLVVYPIVPLPRRDVHDWLRRLEAFGGAIAAAFDVAWTPSVDGTGVFAGARKFASIGVAVKRWVNLHGIAVNVAMDLGPWHQVRPCGLDPNVMTDLTRAAGRPIALAEAAAAARTAVSALLAPGDPV